MANKSAVVIIKRGDPGMADSMAETFMPLVVQDDKLVFLERENFFLKRRRTRTTRRMIREAQIKYGHNYIPRSEFGKRLREGWALVEYGIAMFADRFMTIQGVNKRG